MSSVMPAARRLTAPRARNASMTPSVSTVVARNTSSASIMVEPSSNTPARMSAAPIAQILKFTSRYMMKLPSPIQAPAIASAFFVTSSCQTLA